MNKLNGFSEWLHQKIKPFILLIAIIVFAMFMLIVLPAVSETTKEITGTSSSPDTSFFYTSEDLYDITASYGEAGRAYYIRSRFSFDIIWPIVYLFFLVSMMTFLFKNTLNLIPFVGVLFDFLENLGASFVMYRYPLDARIIATITPVFTLLKWVFIFASFALIIIGLIRLFFYRLLMKPPKKRQG